jgi:hypothetical protein
MATDGFELVNITALATHGRFAAITPPMLKRPVPSGFGAIVKGDIMVVILFTTKDAVIVPAS